MPMTGCPAVSAMATHSMAHTWVTMINAPGSAARKMRDSRSVASRMPVSRAASRRRAARLARLRRVRACQRPGGRSS